jgi:hypothetical protein
MGVIAVAVYRERVLQPLLEEKLKREGAPAAPSMESVDRQGDSVQVFHGSATASSSFYNTCSAVCKPRKRADPGSQLS